MRQADLAAKAIAPGAPAADVARDALSPALSRVQIEDPADAEGDDEYEYEAASDEEAEGADPADADDVQVRVPSEQEAMMRAILDSARESGSLGKR